MDKKRRLESNDGDFSQKKINLKKLLAPLPSDKLIELLVKIGSEVEYAYTEIEKTANEDLSQRKVFIHGLPWDCTKEDLVAPFSVFGEVEDTNVVMDNTTGRTKGYGFVTFKNMADAYKALGVGSVQVKDRTVQMKLAALRSNPILTGESDDTTMRKLFVRGLQSHHTVTDLENLFKSYGDLEEVKITTDRTTGQSKGYGFVTFVQASAATAALEIPHKDYGGRTIHCKLAALGAPKKKEEPLMGPQRDYMGNASVGPAGMGPAAQALAARRAQQTYTAAAAAANPYQAPAANPYQTSMTYPPVPPAPGYPSTGSYYGNTAGAMGQPMQTNTTTQANRWG